jgi:hypothetical protein
MTALDSPVYIPIDTIHSPQREPLYIYRVINAYQPTVTEQASANKQDLLNSQPASTTLIFVTRAAARTYHVIQWQTRLLLRRDILKPTTVLAIIRHEHDSCVSPAY